jgi:hypothetical protein
LKRKKRRRNYAGSENHSPHILRKGCEYSVPGKRIRNESRKKLLVEEQNASRLLFKKIQVLGYTKR